MTGGVSVQLTGGTTGIFVKEGGVSSQAINSKESLLFSKSHSPTDVVGKSLSKLKGVGNEPSSFPTI